MDCYHSLVRRTTNKRRAAATSRAGKVRIIAGRWRGRRLDVVAHQALRPTSDRIRETLFNWLGTDTRDARCLDLFAGTGALGFEAASRGASEVVLVESDRDVVAQLERQCQRFEADQVTVARAEAQQWLQRSPSPFDIVFLDPPFGAEHLRDSIEALETGAWLKPCAWVYLELGAAEILPSLPASWSLTRDKTAGQVRYCLARRELSA